MDRLHALPTSCSLEEVIDDYVICHNIQGAGLSFRNCLEQQKIIFKLQVSLSDLITSVAR